MKKNRLLFLLAVLLCTVPAFSQSVSLKTGNTKISLNNEGYYTSIAVNGTEILSNKKNPIVTACVGKKLVLPKKLVATGNKLRVTMEDNSVVGLAYAETPNCITLEVTEAPAKYDALLFGPVAVNIHEVVGDVIGVVQGKNVAFGVQALNIKTTVGIPLEYSEAADNLFGIAGKGAETSTGNIQTYRQAAVDMNDGAEIQFSCRNRSRVEHRKVLQLDDALVLPVKGPDALIKGAKIGIFGCEQAQALARIGKIEVEQGLPHPMFDGEWGKTARKAMRSYLITDYSVSNLDFVLDKAEVAGLKYVYHGGPFLDWGHFNWDKSFAANDEEVKGMVDKAAKRGIGLGVHTLSNFMTTNDAYVTPIPSEHLLKQGVLSLLGNLDATQTEIRIKKSDLFTMPMTLNAMMIDKELITYGKADSEGDVMVLKNCKRGAFGTTAAAHQQKTALYKLWDYPYNTLFPDLELQDKFVDRLVEIFNKTGLVQTSFDGLEGCTYTGQEDYATARFVDRFYRGLNHNVVNDASNLNHFTWHIHSRMNWGEPWGEAMRTGQVENRIKNQKFFRRNLFPRMLGWFLIRLNDKKFECSTLEDTEWALSKSAGFDAGYAMTIGIPTLKKHGQIDLLLKAIRYWDELRESQSFSKEQMERFRDPATEWHLEKQNDHSYLLYPLSISKPYHCMLGEMQPGQSGGADWSLSTPYAGKLSFRLHIDGDGAIKNPKFSTDKGVVSFPCTIEDGQYLLYGFDGKAQLTDKNYNVIQTVQPEGEGLIPSGDSHIAFSCDRSGDSTPEVIVRFITHGSAETIVKK